MVHEIFYIMAVICIRRDGLMYYYVTTNAGTSVFCPAERMLPSMVISFLEQYSANSVQLAPDVVAVYKLLS